MCQSDVSSSSSVVLIGIIKLDAKDVTREKINPGTTYFQKETGSGADIKGRQVGKLRDCFNNKGGPGVLYELQSKLLFKYQGLLPQEGC